MKLAQGIYVKHKTKPIQGRIVGVTRIKKLFERAEDDVEYRVQTGADEIKICSISNLEPQIPDGRYSHCYKCQLQVDPNNVVCQTCGWFICSDSKCSACGCNSFRF